MVENIDVSLRHVQDSDLDHFFAHQQDADARHMAAFVSTQPQSREAFDQHWARIRGLDTVLIRTILVHENGREEVAGHVAKFLRDDVPEVTYWIDRKYWGKGAATMALTCLLAEVSDRPIYGRVAFDNMASRRVLEKCGFRLTAEELGFAEARGNEIEELIYAYDR